MKKVQIQITQQVHDGLSLAKIKGRHKSLSDTIKALLEKPEVTRISKKTSKLEQTKDAIAASMKK